MPEQLASQLEALHTEVRRRVESAPAENVGEDLPRQALHQVIGERLGRVQQAAGSSAQVGAAIPPQVQQVVDGLVSKAIGKNLDEAIEEAKKSSDPVVLDAFHDAVVGELYDRLVGEGKLKALDK